MLANVIRKELEQIFCQFDSKLEAADEVRCQCPRSVGLVLPPRGPARAGFWGLGGSHLVRGLAAPHWHRPGRGVWGEVDAGS